MVDDELASPEATAAGFVVRHGMYGHNLDVYRERFGPDLIRVFGFDELVREPARVLAECQGFLGVTPRRLVLEKSNAARESRLLPVTRAIQWLGRYQGGPKRIARRFLGEMPGKRLREAMIRAVSKPTKNPPLAPALLARLTELYASDSEQFHRVVGRPLWDP